MTKLMLVAITLVAAACGKGGDKAAVGGAPAKAIDAAAVNALVPAALKDKFVFEESSIVEKRGRSKTIYKVAAPKGWKQDMESFAHLKPPTDLGFMTQFKIGTNCDGSCEPKDWAAVVDKQVKQFGESKLLKDEKGPNKRTVIAEVSDGDTLILVAWWKDGDRQYQHCGGTLDKSVKEAAAAFEKACESVTVTEE